MMNPQFLLKLVSDLIKDDKPTLEQVKCARVIVDGLIKEYEPKEFPTTGDLLTRIPGHVLSLEAEQARQELQ